MLGQNNLLTIRVTNLLPGLPGDVQFALLPNQMSIRFSNVVVYLCYIALGYYHSLFLRLEVDFVFPRHKKNNNMNPPPVKRCNADLQLVFKNKYQGTTILFLQHLSRGQMKIN